MAHAARVSQFPVIDRESAQKFLEYLDPDTDKFTFQTFTDSDERKKTYTRDVRTGHLIDPLAKVLHGTLDEHWATFVDLSRQGAGVFVTVNRTTLRGRRNQENITEVRAYFADCDRVSPAKIKTSLTAIGLTPHIFVQSSAGKWHTYWCVTDAPKSGFGATQKNLSALFGSDPSVCDRPRVMRLPGFPHQKDDSNGALVSLVHTYEGENYPDAVFQEALAKAIAASGCTVPPDKNPSEPGARVRQRQPKKLTLLAIPAAPLWSEEEAAKLRSALDYRHATGERVWDPDDDYVAWTTVAPAIASLGWGQNGEDIFVEWSAQARTDGIFPGDEACRAKIRSFKRGRTAGCITEATIYKKARDAGWRESRPNTSSDKTNFERGDVAAANADKNRGAGIMLPVIEVIGGGLSNAATAGEQAIIRAGHQVYRRGTMLVRPIVEEFDATRARKTKVAQLLALSQPYMTDLLCRSAEWKRYDRRLNQTIRVNPPDNIARVILGRSGEWQFNEIVGVITTPTLRPDDSLLVRAGYDPATRMVLMDPPPMPNIPERPTRGDAMAALKLLDGLLDEFPFADNASRSVALSCLITPVVRAAFTVAPMHSACAPSAGTGKSYLFDIAAAIAIGQPCPVMAAGRTEEETEKRLGAALLAGQPIINIDNVNGELGGDALCQIIERPFVEIRPLGKSERVRIESRTTVFATGNNLRLLGDMTRRVLRAMLDAKKERPELREFKRDPVAEVLADRGRYVAAALTIVRAYIVAGSPRVAPRLASFEGWSDTVRSPLMRLDRPDPAQTMESASKDDPTLQAMEAVFAALKEAIGSEHGYTVSEIIQLADQRVQASPFDPPLNSLGDHPLKHSGLKEALQNIAGDRGGIIDPRALGKWFRGELPRVFGLRARPTSMAILPAGG